MDDDLNTPRALALAHDALRDGNQAYAEGRRRGRRSAGWRC